MQRRYIILLLFVLFSSCEKSQDNDILLKFYGDAYEDIGYSIAKTDDGYFLAGQITEITRTQNDQGSYIDGSIKRMGIIKTGFDGNTIWKKSLGDKQPAVGSKVLALDDGSVICLGYIVDTTTLKDIFIAKVDAGGNVLAQKIFISDGNQYGTDIIKTQEGFLILGTTDVERFPLTDASGNVAGKKDILLLRINNNLEEVISPVATGFPGNDEGSAIKADLNGGYIVVGTTDRSDRPLNEQAGNNILLLRINADGSIIGPRIIGDTEDEYAADIEVLSDSYLIAGTVGNENSVQKGRVWEVPYDIYSDFFNKINIVIESSSTVIKAIHSYKTSSFVMAGQIGIGSSAQMLIFVTDAQGNLIEGKMKEFGGTGVQVAYDVITDDDNNIIMIGKNSYENNSMISLLKFRF